MRPLPFLVLLLFVPLTLAGCSAPPGEEEVLLQVTERIGEQLYVWADPDFSAGASGAPDRTLRARFTVPDNVSGIAVSFTGEFQDLKNSSAVFAIEDDEDRQIVHLEARPGGPDDDGTIERFWRFDRLLRPTPATYDISMTGNGTIGYIDFEVHGLPEGNTTIDEAFQVSRSGAPLQVELFLRGWGTVPAIRIVGPDGQEEPVGIVAAEDQATLEVTPQQEGTWRLVADTTGWGGRFVARVTQ